MIRHTGSSSGAAPPRPFSSSAAAQRAVRRGSSGRREAAPGPVPCTGSWPSLRRRRRGPLAGQFPAREPACFHALGGRGCISPMPGRGARAELEEEGGGSTAGRRPVFCSGFWENFPRGLGLWLDFR